MIEARDLGVTYPARNGNHSVEALAGLDLCVRGAEFLGIVGPSGCGKSTLLRTIGGLVAPTRGKVVINGDSPDVARQNRLYSFDFQDPALIPSRTALRNVQLPGEVMKRPDVVKRAGEVLRLVGLEGYQNALPYQLSGGMKARVALARALSFAPEILLLDEPFGSLDALTRERLNMDLLSIWRQAACTVVFVTHSIPEACLLCDRVAVMTPQPGRIARIVEIGLSRPRSLESQFDPAFMSAVADIRAAMVEGAV